MLSLSTTKTFISRTFGRTGLVLQKNSPEIMLGAGVVGIVAGTVMACKATLKADKIIKEYKETVEKIEKVRNLVDVSYSDQDYQRDLVITYVKTGVKFVELYGPSILVLGGSLVLIVGAHNILTKRNAALAAAYSVIDKGFKAYRDRVRKELGEDADHKFRFGETPVESDDTPPWDVEAGDKKSCEFSLYARYFDQESSRQFQKSYELNEFFLRCQQNFANDMLRARGHIFLNEVYDMLGLSRTKEGAVVGWVKGHGDEFVNIGYLNPENEREHPSRNQRWLLDFNVDGVIYDMI